MFSWPVTKATKLSPWGIVSVTQGALLPIHGPEETFNRLFGKPHSAQEILLHLNHLYSVHRKTETLSLRPPPTHLTPSPTTFGSPSQRQKMLETS